MRKYILDRLEGNYAILENEDGSMIEINIDDIKGQFKEGDILIKEDKKFIVNKNLGEERREKIKKMMNNIWE